MNASGVKTALESDISPQLLLFEDGLLPLLVGVRAGVPQHGVTSSQRAKTDVTSVIHCCAPCARCPLRLPCLDETKLPGEGGREAAGPRRLSVPP